MSIPPRRKPCRTEALLPSICLTDHPTAFNGDRLATMEAMYAAGGNAGPHNWTSFKEFSRTFKPTYAANEISLTQGFFNEVNDGTVILKFHFWSGAIIEYTITKNGTSITGSGIVEQESINSGKKESCLAPRALGRTPLLPDQVMNLIQQRKENRS